MTDCSGLSSVQRDWGQRRSHGIQRYVARMMSSMSTIRLPAAFSLHVHRREVAMLDLPWPVSWSLAQMSDSCTALYVHPHPRRLASRSPEGGRIA